VSRRAVGRAEEGGGRCYLACGRPATGARRGRAQGRRRQLRSGWGGLVCRGEGQRRLYRSRADPPSDHLTGGDTPGDARAGRQGRDRRSIAGCTAPRGSKRSRCPRPREARSGRGKARPTSGTRVGGTRTPRRRRPAARRARRAGRRDVAARPSPGVELFGPGYFECGFLLKIEYKCTKR
jgi:hypothetical protein